MGWQHHTRTRLQHAAGCTMVCDTHQPVGEPLLSHSLEEGLAVDACVGAGGLAGGGRSWCNFIAAAGDGLSPALWSGWRGAVNLAGQQLRVLQRAPCRRVRQCGRVSRWLGTAAVWRAAVQATARPWHLRSQSAARRTLTARLGTGPATWSLHATPRQPERRASQVRGCSVATGARLC